MNTFWQDIAYGFRMLSKTWLHGLGRAIAGGVQGRSGEPRVDVDRLEETLAYRPASWQTYSNISPPGIHFEAEASEMVQRPDQGPV